MAQEDGWPLGLQPLNMRVGLIRSHNYAGSISFDSLLTRSQFSSSFTSSDLNSESTRSLLHGRSITLGRLIGLSSMIEMPSREIRSRKLETYSTKRNNGFMACFSLCLKASSERKITHSDHSLNHFLEIGREVNTHSERNHETPLGYELYDLTENQIRPERNSLFMNGRIVPPPTKMLVQQFQFQT